MSFYLRKAIRVGPLRFNLSKSGVGVSGGIKGFRLGAGPRGNYVHMGRGGIYYRKTLPVTRQSSQPAPRQFQQNTGDPYGQLDAPPLPQVNMVEIESGDVAGMAHSSSSELLQEIQDKGKAIRFTPLAWAVSVGVMAWAALQGVTGFPLMLLGALLIGGILYCSRWDALRKTVVLFYEFDDALEKASERLHLSAHELATCRGKWHISAQGHVSDTKYTGGASTVVNRKPTSIRIDSPPFLKSNIKTVAFDAGRQTLYFFPDRILVFDSGNVGAVGYSELKLHIASGRFIESESVPADAQIVDYTWQYVNKKGGPDKRFANNRQIPICMYDEIHLWSRSGLNELIQVSRCGIAHEFSNSVALLAQHV